MVEANPSILKFINSKGGLPIVNNIIPLMEYFDFNGNKTEPKPFNFDNFKVEIIQPASFNSKDFSIKSENGKLKITSKGQNIELDEGQIGFLIKYFVKTPSQE